MIKLLILCLVLLCSPSQAADKWDRVDYTLLATSTALKFIDWRQTLYVTNHPRTETENGYHEANPILGQRPSNDQVHLYFLGTLAAEIAIAHFLPSSLRKPWLLMWIGISGWSINHNESVGIGIRW